MQSAISSTAETASVVYPEVTPEIAQARALRKQFHDEFRKLALTKQLTATHMLAYCLMMGKPIKKSFSPVTKPSKLRSGQIPWGAVNYAHNGLLWQLKSKRMAWSHLPGIDEVLTDRLKQVSLQLAE